MYLIEVFIVFSAFFRMNFDNKIEDLKNSGGIFFGEMGVYIKNLVMQFCCVLFHVLLCKILT